MNNFRDLCYRIIVLKRVQSENIVLYFWMIFASMFIIFQFELLDDLLQVLDPVLQILVFIFSLFELLSELGSLLQMLLFLLNQQIRLFEPILSVVDDLIDFFLVALLQEALSMCDIRINGSLGLV